MEIKKDVGAKLISKKPTKKKFFKKKQPYLLPCGNEREYCFLKVRRNNANFCRTWKKIIWHMCRWHIETSKYKWESR